MSKKGELKDMDAFEMGIRENAVAYNVVCFQPGVSSRVRQSFNDLRYAIEYSRVILEEPNRIRSAMIYAIDSGDHHALVGTMTRNDLTFKEVIPKRY